MNQYTIGQVSEMFGIPISTLRYYDNEGLFTGLERISGIRKFTNKELEELRVIECLKKSGLEIKDIKQFMIWCKEGSATYSQRLELFNSRKKSVEEEIKKLQKTLSLINFKCWYYEKALKDGNEDEIRKMFPDKFPKKIQQLYNEAH